MTVTVSSAEFLKSYGRLSETALSEPVSITSHGRERLTLISTAEYRRLKANDRQALYAWELDDETLTAIENARAPDEAKAFDHDVE